MLFNGFDKLPPKVRLTFLSLLSLLGVGGVVWGVLLFKNYQKQRSAYQAHELEQTAKREQMISELRKRAFKVSPADIEIYVKAPGVVDFHPKHALRIHPTFAGVVTKIHKNLGDAVSAGEVLASVDSNMGIQVFTLTSPIKGVVLSRSASEGQSVNPEDEVFAVGDVSLLQARIAISARDILKVKAQQSVLLIAENRQPIPSKISFLSPILAEDSRTSPAIIDVTGADLRPGMFVTGAVIIAKEPAAKTVPFEFCENGVELAALTVIGKDGPENRDVQFGRRDYYHCEVRSGLELGEEVIARGDLMASHEEQNKKDESVGSQDHDRKN